MLRLSQCFALEQEQSQRITQTQRQTLALFLRVVLVSPLPKNVEMIRGLKGVQAADKVLRKNQATGILIGGLARKAWERTFDIGDFDKKDVDVLVLPQENHGADHMSFARKCKGIDWWLSHSKMVSVDNLGAKGEVRTMFFKNINNIVLRFAITNVEGATPGLYLLDLGQLINLLQTEAEAVTGKTLDEWGSKSFEENLRRQYQKSPSKHLPAEYKDKFLPNMEFSPIDSATYAQL